MKIKRLLYIAILLLLPIWAISSMPNNGKSRTEMKERDLPETTETAIFAGGCFWCMEHPFEEMDGVYEVISGYTGGVQEAPSYEEVSSGATGHVEAVSIRYDPAKVSYKSLLEKFWKQIDPTDDEGQFVDRGMQYTTAIFYTSETQRITAEESKADLAASGRFDDPIITPIIAAHVFYPAEGYHQDYYKENPIRYKFYRSGSGRDKFLKKAWKKELVTKSAKASTKPSKEVLRKRLTALQYHVTQEEGTERAFENEYWDNKKAGIYVDIVSGEPLFSSTDKFKSGTGWPSFTRPIEKASIVEREDTKFFMTRVEVRSARGDSHLGHLFDDGPAPTGLRYCINSASLRFVPVESLESEGLGDYLKLFK